MVCDGPGDFWDARSLVDDGEVVKTQDTELGRDGWCPRAATSHSIFQHGPLRRSNPVFRPQATDTRRAQQGQKGKGKKNVLSKLLHVIRA